MQECRLLLFASSAAAIHTRAAISAGARPINLMVSLINTLVQVSEGGLLLELELDGDGAGHCKTYRDTGSTGSQQLVRVSGRVRALGFMDRFRVLG